MKTQRAFTVLKCTWLWKRRYKHFGGNLETIHRNTVRHRFLFVASFHVAPFKKKAMKPLEMLLITSYRFIIKVRETRIRVCYI